MTQYILNTKDNSQQFTLQLHNVELYDNYLRGHYTKDDNTTIDAIDQIVASQSNGNILVMQDLTSLNNVRKIIDSQLTNDLILFDDKMNEVIVCVIGFGIDDVESTVVSIYFTLNNIYTSVGHTK